MTRSQLLSSLVIGSAIFEGALAGCASPGDVDVETDKALCEDEACVERLPVERSDAASAGASCTSSDDCDDGHYCVSELGCGGEGTCVPAGDATCATEYAPVCGCDGHTWTNACFAAALGMDIDYEGECRVPCSVSDPCAPGMLCVYPENAVCGAGDEPGECWPMPDACTQSPDDEAVCGCDGEIYASACIARARGVDLAPRAACPALLTCDASTPCPDGSFCAFDDHACGASGGSGRCALIPTACTDTPEPPVCGCDDRFYESACFAQTLGVDVRRELELGEPPATCADATR